MEDSKKISECSTCMAFWHGDELCFLSQAQLAQLLTMKLRRDRERQREHPHWRPLGPDFSFQVLVAFLIQ